jgi:hypothetical protein
MRRLRLLLLVPSCVLSGGLLLSACGGDSSPEIPITVPTEATTGTGAAATSKEAFITQADAICAEANAAIEQFAAAGQGLTEADQIAALRQGVVDEVGSLPAPAEDQATLTQFLEGMSAQVAAGQKIALAQQRGEDTAQFEAELDTAKSATETAAAAYGFKECGQPITATGTGTTEAPGGAAAPVEPSAPAPVAPAPSDSGGTGGDTGGAGGTDGAAGGDSGGAGGGLGPG